MCFGDGHKLLFIIFPTPHHYQPPLLLYTHNHYPHLQLVFPDPQGWIRVPSFVLPQNTVLPPSPNCYLGLALLVCESVFPLYSMVHQRRNCVFFIVFLEAGSCLVKGRCLPTFLNEWMNLINSFLHNDFWILTTVDKFVMPCVQGSIQYLYRYFLLWQGILHYEISM